MRTHIWPGTWILLLLILGTTNAFGERVDGKIWSQVKLYDMAALKTTDVPMRKIVGVRFNYRHPNIRHLKPNWYQGSVWTLRRTSAEEFDYIQVMVSKADLESFRTIPSEMQSERTFEVYGQVLRDFESGFTFLRLFGRKVRREANGDALVTW